MGAPPRFLSIYVFSNGGGYAIMKADAAGGARSEWARPADDYELREDMDND